MSHKSKDSIEARDLKSHLHGFSDFNSMQNVGSIIMSMEKITSRQIQVFGMQLLGLTIKNYKK